VVGLLLCEICIEVEVVMCCGLDVDFMFVFNYGGELYMVVLVVGFDLFIGNDVGFEVYLLLCGVVVVCSLYLDFVCF